MQKINGTGQVDESCMHQPDMKEKNPLCFPCLLKYLKNSVKIGDRWP